MGGAGTGSGTTGFATSGGFDGAGVPPPPRAAGLGSGTHTRCSGVSRVTILGSGSPLDENMKSTAMTTAACTATDTTNAGVR